MAGGRHSHTWENSSAQGQALERNQATAKSEKGVCGMPWQVCIQKEKSGEGGDRRHNWKRNFLALEPEKGSKVEPGQGQEGQCWQGPSK